MRKAKQRNAISPMNRVKRTSSFCKLPKKDKDVQCHTSSLSGALVKQGALHFFARVFVTKIRRSCDGFLKSLNSFRPFDGLVGPVGLEPTASCTPCKRATTAPWPDWKIPNVALRAKWDGGRREIRTLGTLRFTRFPSVRTRPLCDPSTRQRVPDCEKIYKVVRCCDIGL